MKSQLLLFLFIFACFVSAAAQIKVPKNFSLVKGPGPTARLDYYTDGQYKLSEQTPFQGGMPTTDQAIMNQLSADYGIPFNKQNKNFYYGTGFKNGVWKYVVLVKGLAFVLTSPMNNSGFQHYSKWLFGRLNTAIMGGDQLYLRE
jgi:hypothetical protein